MNRQNNLLDLVFNDYRIFRYYNFCKIPEKIQIDGDLGFFLKHETRLHSSWDFMSEHNNEDSYVENYGNLCSSVYHNRVTIIVGKTDNKVFIKFFSYRKHRERGRKYFKTHTKVNYLTYNYITNSLYTGYITDYHKKRKFCKKIKKNDFICFPINSVRSFLNNFLTSMGEKNTDLLLKKNDIIEDVIITFFKNIPGINVNFDLTYDQILYQHHLIKNGIKLPNNWTSFYPFYPQPTKKDFVKNKMKYIDTIMYLHDLNGDKVKKVLHLIHKNFNPYTFNWLCKTFGKDYILNQDVKLLQLIFEGGVVVEKPNFDLTDSKIEKENAFTIFKLCLIGEINYNTFIDHIRMYKQLQKFEDVKWKSNTYDSFNNEHLSFTERLEFYTKGEYRRIYNNEFIDRIQKPIITDEKYYPVVLTTSKEYIEESNTQSNCVKGYIASNTNSLIISLRKNDVDSKDRATIEYRIENINDEIKLKRVQTLGRFNRGLNQEWNDPISLLDLIIEETTKNKIFTLPSIECIYGNRTIVSESKFVNMSEEHHDKILRWENNEVYNMGNDFLIFDF